MAVPSPRQGPPLRERRRPASISRPVNGRLYRAVLALVALPAVLAALSVGNPPPLPSPQLPPTFDGDAALSIAREFASLFPDRAPGTKGAREAAAWVEEQLTAAKFRVTRQTFETTIPGRGKQTLVNLVATPRGREGDTTRSADTIVVLAHRDNLGLSPGANDNGSGTAVLLELAREIGTTALGHTLVFVSTDGGAYGGLGARQLARLGAANPQSPFSRSRALAVVNLSALAGRGAPRLIFGGDGARLPSPSLLTTADAAVIEQTGDRATRAGGIAQLIDLAFPLSLYEQAPFLDEGVSALTLSSAGDRPPLPATDTPEALQATTLTALGRAAQGLVASLDQAAEVARGTESYVYLGGRAVRGWAIGLTLLAGLLPVIAATGDLLVRCRRRRIALAPALRSFRSRFAVWLWVAGLIGLMTVLGRLPHGAGRPLPLDLKLAQEWQLVPLVVIAVLGLVGWLVARGRLVPRGDEDADSYLAGHAIAMLALCGVGLAIAIVDPFALLLVLPSLHAWLWVPQLRQYAIGLRITALLLGLAGPSLVVASLAGRYDLGLDTPWYLLTLVTTGHVSIALVVLFAAWLAAGGQVAAIAFGRYAPYPGPDERGLGPIRNGVRRTVLGTRRYRRRRAARRQAHAARRGGSESVS